MSLESALEEERREIIRILEGRPAAPVATAMRNQSVAMPRPARSMLDVESSPPVLRHHSVAGTSEGISPHPQTSPASPVPQPRYRSMLDFDSPPPPPSTVNTSLKVSISNQPQRSQSIAFAPSVKAGNSGRKGSIIPVDTGGRKGSIAPMDTRMNFSGFAADADGAPISRQKTGSKQRQRGSEDKEVPMAMRKQLYQADEDGVPIPVMAIPSGNAARVLPSDNSPGRYGRSKSPRMRNSPMNLMSDPRMITLQTGETIDLNKAYRRLSDAKLSASDGGLARLPQKKVADKLRQMSGETLAPNGGTRMTKDHYDSEEAIDTSDEESDDGLDHGFDGFHRGRQKGRPRGGDGNEDTPASMGKAAGPRKPMSMLAAAEEERHRISQSTPQVVITSPGQLPQKKSGVHPNTNFDVSASAPPTPHSSDSEADMGDIRKAQRLAIAVGETLSTPDSYRLIRSITRGEYVRITEEAKEEDKKVRRYVVCTDLSDQSAHALEWTIGTILRDGDQLIAIYAMDLTEAIKAGDLDSHSGGLDIGEGGNAFADHDSVLSASSSTKQHQHQHLLPTPAGGTPVRPGTPLLSSIKAHSRSKSGGGSTTPARSASPSTTTAAPGGATINRAEAERRRATEVITGLCVRLLRKTKLQVQIVVEVIHCRSPKHLLTEAIDYLDPTLVVLGSRGRSSLKGVLLGSFSNYLVSKSSVPVMVARKRLKKHSKHTANVKMSNNLSVTRGLASAKID